MLMHEEGSSFCIKAYAFAIRYDILMACTQSYTNSEENSMKVVVAIDSFKGSLSSIEAGNTVQKGILTAHPDAMVVVKPIADGGVETTDALIEGMHGELITLTVTGPMHTLVDAYYGYLKDCGTAVMESHNACTGNGSPYSKKKPDCHSRTGFSLAKLRYITFSCCVRNWNISPRNTCSGTLPSLHP